MTSYPGELAIGELGMIPAASLEIDVKSLNQITVCVVHKRIRILGAGE